MLTKRVISIMVAVSLAISLIHCSQKSEPHKTSQPGVTLQHLQNAAYDIGSEPGDYPQLIDGEFEFYDTTGGMTLYFGFWLFDAAFGDLNNDKIEDAAAVVAWNGGGSGTFFRLVSVTDKDAYPINSDIVALGDRVDIKKIAIVDGTIILNLLTHGPQDGLCCPSVNTTYYFRYENEHLIEVGK